MTTALQPELDDTLLRLVVQELKEIVFRTDVAGRWTFLNPAWEEITGFSIEESLGTGFLDYVYPRDRRRNQELFQPLIERRKDYCRHEIRYRKKGGGFCWMEVHARLVFDAAGEVAGTCGTIRDVTERHNGLEELRSTKARLEFLLGSSPAVVLSGHLRPGYPINYVSENLLGLLGYRPRDFGRDPFVWSGLVHPEDMPEVERAVAKLAGEGSTVLRLRAAHRDGSYRWLRCDLRLADAAPGATPSFVASIVDITATKEAEENLAQREAILRGLNFAARHFLGSEVWEQQLEGALVPLVEALGADRMRLFRFADDETGETVAHLQHSWRRSAARAEEEVSRPEALPVVASGLGRWLKRLRARQVVAGTVADLPPGEGAFLARLDLEAFAAAPVFSGDTIWGCVTLSSGRPLTWSGAQLDALQAAAEILGAAFHHQQSHEDLRITKERLQCVIDSSPVVIFTADPATSSTTWISDNVEALLGVPAARYLEDPQFWWQQIHPADREKMAEFLRSLGGGGPNTIQIRHLNPQGAICWMRVEMRVIADAAGRPAAIVGCLVDTSETMQALENLERREAILEAVNFVAGQFLHGEDWQEAVPRALEELGKVAAADRVRLIQFTERAGAPPMVELRKEWSAPAVEWPDGAPGLAREGDTAPVIPEVERCLRLGMTVAGCIGEFPAAVREHFQAQGVGSLAMVPIFVGPERWGQIAFLRQAAEEWSRPTLDGLQVATGILGAAIRQTRARHSLRQAHDELEDRVRQRTEELAIANRALGESEQLYRTLIETSPDCIVVTDPDQRVRMLNRRGVELFGFASAEESIGEMAAGWLLAPERTLVRRDGTPFQAEMSCARVAGGTIGIIRDVTGRKQLEEQFRQAQKMEAIGRLAGGVAHDFNNLLTVIKGYGEILSKRLAEDASSSRKLAQIVKASDRAAALVEQLLAFSRKQMVEPKVVDVSAAIHETEKMLRRLIGEDIEFRTRLDPAAGRVRVDPGQLDQLIMNLTVNARDAMESGGALGISTASITVADGDEPPAPGMPPGRYARIEVRDSGTGMSEETRRHIFEPFFTTKPVGKGTGLGLSTVYGIVQQSGGFIGVETAPGKGSAFHIYLPEAAGGEAATQAAAESQRVRGQETILAVEDSDAVRAILVETLSECGYAVLQARHGRHALEVAAGYPGRIDMLLTDVVMPQMGGPELWTAIHALLPEMRLLYISGNVGRDLDPRAPFLKKPFSTEQLAAKVREVLDAAQ